VKKIKRAVKRILKVPYSKADYNQLALQKIQSARQFSNVKMGKTELSFVFEDVQQLYARLLPHSDTMVLEQVIIGEEYKAVTDYFKANLHNIDKLNIIDAGANVGYSSAFFLKEFPLAQVACVEPDEQNIGMLKKNLSAFIQKQQVSIYKNGLMSDGDRNIVTKKDFRDGKDWSVSVTETETESDLKSVTVEQIRQQMKWEYIDILKIDIEGAERFVFGQETDLSYLQFVKTIAIEIHDEFGIRQTIYEQFRKKGFVLFNFGETTFAVNKQFIK
jgi:FkbM family methyltransferase